MPTCLFKVAQGVLMSVRYADQGTPLQIRVAHVLVELVWMECDLSLR